MFGLTVFTWPVTKQRIPSMILWELRSPGPGALFCGTRYQNKELLYYVQLQMQVKRFECPPSTFIGGCFAYIPVFSILEVRRGKLSLLVPSLFPNIESNSRYLCSNLINIIVSPQLENQDRCRKALQGVTLTSGQSRCALYCGLCRAYGEQHDHRSHSD
jgi:hypothetical protein